ncbi:MAG TPA: septal ring lytic transglycosylase RlpA family protein [Thermoanaerobaculia bacterium]
MSGRGLAAGVLALALAGACASRAQRAPTVAPESGAQETGLASWYGGAGDGFAGKPTASGEIFDPSDLTAAHRTLPFGTIVDVTLVATGETVRVRVNDRGPFVRGRVVDLSREAARQVGLIGPGVAPVTLRVVTAAAVIEPVSETGQWAVQVGSFAVADNAERHAERVRAAGMGAWLEAWRGLSRVKVGPFDSRAEAEAALAELEVTGFEGIIVPVQK